MNTSDIKLTAFLIVEGCDLTGWHRRGRQVVFELDGPDLEQLRRDWATDRAETRARAFAQQIDALLAIVHEAQ